MDRLDGPVEHIIIVIIMAQARKCFSLYMFHKQLLHYMHTYNYLVTTSCLYNK